MTVPAEILGELDGPARRAVEWIDARVDVIENTQSQQADTADIIVRLDAIEAKVTSDESGLYFTFFSKFVAAMEAAGTVEGREAVYAKLNAALDT